MIRGSLVLSLWMLETEYSGFGVQYHACWCPGDLSRQGITRHGIDWKFGLLLLSKILHMMWIHFYNLKTIQRVKSWYGYPLECTLCCVLYFSCSKWFHLLSIKFSWCCDRSILLLLWSFFSNLLWEASFISKSKYENTSCIFIVLLEFISIFD